MRTTNCNHNTPLLMNMARWHPVNRVVFLRQQKSLTILSEYETFLWLKLIKREPGSQNHSIFWPHFIPSWIVKMGFHNCRIKVGLHYHSCIFTRSRNNKKLVFVSFSHQIKKRAYSPPFYKDWIWENTSSIFRTIRFCSFSGGIGIRICLKFSFPKL